MYIIYKKSHFVWIIIFLRISLTLKTYSLSNIELTVILQFCFLGDLIKIRFLLDASIFTTTDEEKEEQKSTLQLFLKDVP